MAQCIVNYWGLEVIRTDFLAPYCIVPNRNLQGLPKHQNGHPKVSEQNLPPQNMVWCTREASRPHSGRTTDSTSPRLPAQTRPHQTPHHRGEGGGFPPTRPHTTGRGRGRGNSHPQDPTPQGEEEGGGFPPTRPHTTEEEEEEGRGIPTHQTPHHREGRREGDSQSTPPQPTPTAGT